MSKSFESLDRLTVKVIERVTRLEDDVNALVSINSVLAQENAELKAQVEKLKQEISDLKL